MFRLQIADSKAFPETPRSREISSAKIGCSAHPVTHVATTMLFGRLRFVMPYRRISASRLRWRPFSWTCNLATSLPSRLQLRLADEKKSARRQFSPLDRAGRFFCPGILCRPNRPCITFRNIIAVFGLQQWQKRLAPGTGHGRCKYPSTTVFTKVALEAAAGHFSLNHLSASRLTDVDLRTCFNCK